MNSSQQLSGIATFIYKITKIVRALWLAERRVCRTVCKHGCDVKMLCFSRANHASTNFKKKNEFKTWQFTLFTIPSSAETWKIFTNKLCQYFSTFADILSEKNPYIGRHLFCKTRTEYACKTSCTMTLRLVRFSLLISAIIKCFSFSRESFCICIAWYKHFVSGLRNCFEFSHWKESLSTIIFISSSLVI